MFEQFHWDRLAIAALLCVLVYCCTRWGGPQLAPVAGVAAVLAAAVMKALFQKDEELPSPPTTDPSKEPTDASK